MRETASGLLRELTETHAVPGHEDEVVFLVHNITAAGFVQFVAVGGW